MSGTQEPTVHEARAELVALGCAMRPDWAAVDLDAAVRACERARWPWKRIYREVSTMLFDPQEQPVNLQRAALPFLSADDEIRARYDPRDAA